MEDRIQNTSRAFVVTGADGEPVPVLPGEYYRNTKARCRRMMQNSLSSYARQVYACLELATMGFHQELAVIMDKGRKRPLQPSDLSKQTGIERQNIRIALAELEDAGLVERRADDDGGALRKGHVLIYSWATPREPKCKEDCSARKLQSILQFPEWFPKSWEPLKPLIKRLKLNISIDESSCAQLLSEGEVVARHYQEAEIVVARFLERVCAPLQSEGAYRKKEKETYKEKERGECVVNGKATETAPEPVPPPSPPPFVPIVSEPTNGKPTATAVAVPEPEREQCWEFFRQIMDGCGKPVSVMMSAACRAEFFKYPLAVQQRIAEDAVVRAAEIWNEPRWTPDPLDHLKSRIWDLKPVKRRGLPPTRPLTRQEESDAAMERHYERIRKRMQEGRQSR